MVKPSITATPLKEDDEIETTFRFLDAHQDKGRITIWTLQKRLAPLLYPPNTQATPKEQQALLRSLVGHAASESGLTLAEMKELVLVGPSSSHAHSLGKETTQHLLATAFGYLDPLKEGSIPAPQLTSLLAATEAMTLGEKCNATLLDALDMNKNGKVDLQDFKALVGVKVQDEEEGSKGEDNVQEG